MRRYGLYDATRGLTTFVAVGVAGVLLWAATLVGVQSVTRFWEAMGIVAAAGLVVGLSQVLGGWTKGGRVRVSPTTFLVGFLPTLVCVGWILMATQPGNGWHEGTIVSWSHDLGLMGLVHDLGLWHGVLAFGFGLVLAITLDSVAVPGTAAVEEPVGARRTAPAGPVRDDDTLVADRRGPRWRRRAAYDDAGEAADEPLTAERESVPAGRPRTVAVGPRAREPLDGEE